MRIDRAAVPFLAGSLAPAALFLLLRRPEVAAPFAALGGFMAYFFRDPDRVVPTEPGIVVAPADGRVMIAGHAERSAPPGVWKQVSIFLSPVDVHINRIPMTGRVTKIEYHPGKFLPAYKTESSENERNELWIDGGDHTIVCRQVVGVLARRIVCRIDVGTEVRAGDRFGLMKFGSRMDVFVPTTAELTVAAGERVSAGETIIARLHAQPAAANLDDASRP
jgi:phosphatidylserine decarboxylase